MARVTALFALLPYVLATLAQQVILKAGQTCEGLAKELGKPTDGWKVITGPDGAKRCRRDPPPDIMCLSGPDSEYYDMVRCTVMLRVCALPNMLVTLARERNTTNTGAVTCRLSLLGQTKMRNKAM